MPETARSEERVRYPQKKQVATRIALNETLESSLCPTAGKVMKLTSYAFSFVYVTERGVEKSVELDGLNAADVEKKLSDLLSSGGR